ncbi:NAD(P)H-dependent oxidoreductase [Hymenobacter sp. HSC-4F20]|uniref:flavodoxin family protein n=1 Tax=Hymenobacter sp. HSC-4F20 TaxID=2864135 RepID=UPI001C735161|nr:NAD(P)H-dependent oxidoreductase [Hymenobacter sp. HSC-4F20]MBX0288873.1 NAD(P)H-dependent oxidoreductase [Hymenobacter sp. HSC-4F20]
MSALASSHTPLVILGSARSDGNTRRLVSQVLTEVPHQLLDLQKLPVAAYRYTQDYAPDDAFLSIVEQMQRHSVLVFATPVYWYSMSGILKDFFDRLTDLTEEPHKRLGRGLSGKHVFLLAVGSDPELPEGFEVPFRRTAEYFKMTFEGVLYQSLKQPFPVEEAQQLVQKINSAGQ